VSDQVQYCEFSYDNEKQHFQFEKYRIVNTVELILPFVSYVDDDEVHQVE